MTILDALTASRTAHRQGRALMEKRQFPAARGAFQVALDSRLAARRLDPARSDPSWAEDLKSLHSRRELDRVLGRTLLKKQDSDPDPVGYDEVSRLAMAELAQADADLEAYFRHQLGESRNTATQVNLATPGAVLPPDQWVTFQDGVTHCATCGHAESTHDDDGCSVSNFEGGELVECPCVEYLPASCRHMWVPSSPVQRACKSCGEIQRLQPTIKVEDTLAFQQLQKEKAPR